MATVESTNISSSSESVQTTGSTITNSVVPVKLEGIALEEAIKKQIEYYLSRENLANDFYLTTKMNNEMFVPLEIIANFNKVKVLTTDMQLIVEVMTKSSNVIIDETKTFIKPAFRLQRNIIILRDIPADTPTEEVKGIFASTGKTISSIKSDIGNNWFITFENEDDALLAHEQISGLTFKDKQIKARVKSETLLKSAANSSTGGVVGNRNGTTATTITPTTTTTTTTTTTSTGNTTQSQYTPQYNSHRTPYYNSSATAINGSVPMKQYNRGYYSSQQSWDQQTQQPQNHVEGSSRPYHEKSEHRKLYRNNINNNISIKDGANTRPPRSNGPHRDHYNNNHNNSLNNNINNSNTSLNTTTTPTTTTTTLQNIEINNNNNTDKTNNSTSTVENKSTTTTIPHRLNKKPIKSHSTSNNITSNTTSLVKDNNSSSNENGINGRKSGNSSGRPQRKSSNPKKPHSNGYFVDNNSSDKEGKSKRDSLNSVNGQTSSNTSNGAPLTTPPGPQHFPPLPFKGSDDQVQLQPQSTESKKLEWGPPEKTFDQVVPVSTTTAITSTTPVVATTTSTSTVAAAATSTAIQTKSSTSSSSSPSSKSSNSEKKQQSNSGKKSPSKSNDKKSEKVKKDQSPSTTTTSTSSSDSESNTTTSNEKKQPTYADMIALAAKTPVTINTTNTTTTTTTTPTEPKEVTTTTTEQK